MLYIMNYDTSVPSHNVSQCIVIMSHAQVSKVHCKVKNPRKRNPFIKIKTPFIKIKASVFDKETFVTASSHQLLVPQKKSDREAGVNHLFGRYQIGRLSFCAAVRHVFRDKFYFSRQIFSSCSFQKLSRSFGIVLFPGFCFCQSIPE